MDERPPMIRTNPYLYFDGNTREAMAFYQSVFGGDLRIATFADYHMEGMPADGTMHALLATPDFTLMASDTMPGASASWGGTRNYIMLMVDAGDREVATRLFDALAEGGHVGTPLQRQVWGDIYGQLTDRFGIEWMFDVASS